jgi:hypothetical protein
MAREEPAAQYLATGSGEPPPHREQLDRIRSVLSRAESWEEPPPEVMEGLLAAVGGEGRTPSAGAIPPRRRRGWVAVAAVAAMLAAGVLGAALIAGLASEQTVVEMAGTDLAPQARATAVVRPASTGWHVSLDVADLPPAPAGSYYEGWVWSDDGRGVSIGTFHLRDGESVVLWSGVPLGDYPSIWVTLEEEDSGPEASESVMLRGRAELAGG